MKDNRLTIIVLLVLVLISAAAGYQYFFPAEAERVRLAVVKDCPLHLQACTAQLPSGGEIHFEISPKTPGPTDALQLEAVFKQVEAKAVRVKFEGVKMYMGYLEYDLKQIENGSDSVKFAGKGGLSICIFDVMEWLVIVDVQVKNTIYEIPFELETVYIR